MNDVVPERVHFYPGLVRWTWRGALCALPSFGWALAIGVTQMENLVAIFLGVAIYVLGLAWCTALPVFRTQVEPSDFGWAFRIAANARAGLAPAMFFGPDLWLGLVSTTAVEKAASVMGLPAQSHGGGFGRILFTTVVQGALVSATILVLALALWPARCGYVKLARARRAGQGRGLSFGA